MSLARDDRGNVTQISRKAKPASGLQDTSSSASYPACTVANYRHCNSPAYTIDARGTRRDYQYDSLSGQLAVELAPADASGTRAVTRYSYTAFRYGPVTPPPGYAPANIYLLTAKDECVSSSVPANVIDFTYICPQGSRRREQYSYTPSDAVSPSSYELARVTSDVDNIAAATSFIYDNMGNVTSTTNPKGNISYITYDALRRKIFEISADPDGAGPIKRQVTRHVYDDNGNEIRTETGVGVQPDGSDFAVLRFSRKTFDLNDKLVKVEEVTP